MEKKSVGSLFSSLTGTIAAPAAWLLERVRYAPKFLIMGTLLLIPVFALGFLQFEVNNAQYEFNIKESYGVTYVNPAARLMHAIHRLRIATLASLAGDAKAATRAAEERAAADAVVTSVEEVDRVYGDNDPLTGLKTNARWKQIKGNWEALKAARFANIDEANASFDQLSGMISKLILDDACNYSNLILDPDLDTYWMMDAFCVKLPYLSETIADEASSSLAAIREGQLGSSARVDLAGLYKGMLVTASDLVTLNAETIYKETKDAGVRPALQGFFDGTLGALNGYGATVRSSVIEAETLPTAEQTAAASLAALESVHKLYEALAPQLNKGIVTRANDKYLQPRNAGLLAVGGTVLLMSYLFFALFYSVRRSIRKVGEAAEGMVAGRVQSVALGTNDEIGERGGCDPDQATILTSARWASA
jgi:methyl-accepting chemotaxis protein